MKKTPKKATKVEKTSTKDKKTAVDFSKFDFDGKTPEEIRKIKAAEYRRRYYQSHKKEFSERSMRWQREHPEKSAEYRKKYYENNKDKCSEAMKEFRRNNPDYHKNYWKDYYKKNKKRINRMRTLSKAKRAIKAKKGEN